MNIPNYYEILGVDEKATQDEIKKVYRKLAKENHPDAGGDEENFKRIAEAYDTLGDENKRQQYDMRKNNPFANMGGSHDDLFQQMFNQAFGGRRSQRNAVHDTVIDIDLSVLESYKGAKKEISYRRKIKCDPCNGSGGEKKVCPTCNGQGSVTRQMGSGMFIQMVQVACNTCAGHGQVITNPCYVCKGTGTKEEIKTVEVKLPHGIDDGQFIRLQGVGDFRNGIYGNLVVRVKMNNENNFEKYGPHLIYHAYFDLNDLKKPDFEIPHPDGTLKLKFPKIFDTTKPLRVKSKGFKSEVIGDLLIHQHVRFERD
jgi:molecular chaperone DnaJ